MSKHLHLGNGKLFLSGSRRSALNAGISEEEFEAFEEAVDRLNEMEAEGYINFERERGEIRIEKTEKLEEKVNSDQTGSSITATTPNGGSGGSSDAVTKYEQNSHYWGTSYEFWFNADDASSFADTLEDAQYLTPISSAIAGYFGGVPAVLVGAFWSYALYIKDGIREHNNGGGVVVSFNMVGFYDIGGIPSAPLPDVYSQ